MRVDPPRHIRDIAHLYLSRMRRPGVGAVRLVVAGVNADVIPGFHVANLALAAAARGIPTRIEDASGLPVNAGYFLALDPHCWVSGPNGRISNVAVFARVTFTLAVDPEGNSQQISPADSRDGVEIVHAPPWDTGPEHAHAIALAVSRGGPTVVLYLAERDVEPRPWREIDGGHPGVVRWVAYVTSAGRAVAGDGCAGMFTRWTRALTDPLPVVVRDPGSRLARQYSDAVSNLFGGTPAVVHAGARSRIDPTHAAARPETR